MIRWGDTPIRLAGYMSGLLLLAAVSLVICAASIGLMVLAWHWMVGMMRGGCA
jgi:hypothetical protein